MSRSERLSILGLYNYNPRIFSMMVYPDGMTASEKEIVRDNILLECSDLELVYPSWDSMQIMIKLWSQLEKPVWNRIYSASKLSYNPIENYNRLETETVTTDNTEKHSGEDVNTASGSDSVTASGNDSIVSSGTDSKNYSYNSDTIQQINTADTNSGRDTTSNSNSSYDSTKTYLHDQSEVNFGKTTTTNGETEVSGGGSSTDSTTYGKTDTTTYGKTDTYTHGKTDTYKHGEQIDHDGETTRETHTSGNIGVTTSQQMLQQEIDIAPALNIINIMVQSFKERFCILVY